MDGALRGASMVPPHQDHEGFGSPGLGFFNPGKPALGNWSLHVWEEGCAFICGRSLKVLMSNDCLPDNLTKGEVQTGPEQTMGVGGQLAGRGFWPMGGFKRRLWLLGGVDT